MFVSKVQSPETSVWRGDLTANGARYSHPLYAIVAWFFSPGFKTVSLFRLAAFFYKGRSGKFISKIFWRWGVSVGGCYIAPTARIGHSLALPHAAGVVVGEGSVIGDHVKIYQHVTLGVRSAVQQDYPTIEDGVTIYSGAVLLGAITVGKNSVVAANAVVLQDVPPDSVAVGSPARIIRK